MAESYIKLFRKMADWEWYRDIHTKVLFLHLLITANYTEQKWQGITVLPGQKITSYPHLAAENNLSVQAIRTAINKLKSTGEITVQSTSKYSLITIKNWNDYQLNNTQSNSQATDEQQSNNRRTTTIKESKESKKEKKDKNTNQQPAVADGGYPINKLLDILYKINPTLNYGNKTERSAASRLFQKLGEEKVLKMAEYAVQIHGEQYAPTIATPLELERNMAKLGAYWKKQNANKVTIIE